MIYERKKMYAQKYDKCIKRFQTLCKDRKPLIDNGNMI